MYGWLSEEGYLAYSVKTLYPGTEYKVKGNFAFDCTGKCIAEKVVLDEHEISVLNSSIGVKYWR